MTDKTTRESFGSRIGFVIAAAGSAVGLGNLWKFPYLAGMNGGAAFLFIYIVIILCIGVTAMMCEVVVGRMGGLNAADSFEKLGGKRWKPVGWSGIACAFIILSYYAVIGGWIIRYMIHSFTGLIELAAQGKSAEVFSVFVSNSGEVVFYQALFMVITAALVLLGVKNGIEKSCKIMMPMLFIAMLVLIVRAVTLPGAMKGIEFYLYPDFSKVTAQTVLAALGQGFFSLSLGAGAILIYGSYLPKTVNIIKSVRQICLIDTSVAFLAGLMVFPAVFAFNAPPEAGPGLTFITLPGLFAQMPGGMILSAIFFLLFFLAALTSSISLLEAPTGYLIDHGVKRTHATLIMALLIFLVGLPSAISLAGGLKIGSRDFIDAAGYLTDSIMMPLASMLCCIFAGWSLKDEKLKAELTNNGTINFPTYGLWKIMMKIIAPAAILCIFVTGLKW